MGAGCQSWLGSLRNHMLAQARPAGRQIAPQAGVRRLLRHPPGLITHRLRPGIRSYIAISGVTEMPCTTMDVTTTASVSAVS
jgi:hypothetical protein